MKKIIVIAACLLSSSIVINAQTVQAPAKDTLKKGRANDRLQTAGPKDGWKSDSTQVKIDSLKINNKNWQPGRKKSLKEKKLKS